jgi:hypothetical protein
VCAILAAAGVPTRNVDVRPAFNRKGCVTVSVPAGPDCHGPGRMDIVVKAMGALDTAGLTVISQNVPTTLLVTR